MRPTASQKDQEQLQYCISCDFSKFKMDRWTVGFSSVDWFKIYGLPKSFQAKAPYTKVNWHFPRQEVESLHGGPSDQLILLRLVAQKWQAISHHFGFVTRDRSPDR